MGRTKGLQNNSTKHYLLQKNKNGKITNLYFKTARELAQHLGVTIKFIYDRKRYSFTQNRTKNRLKNMTIKRIF